MPVPDPAVSPHPSRRKVALWVTAGVAAAAGAGLAWRTAGQGDQSGAALWQQRFDTPAGQPLDLSQFRGKGRLIVNFWATWCPPCVAELPMLDRFGRDHADKGWQVLGLAVDQPSSVRKFLATRPVGFPIGMAGLQGTELSRSLGNTQGSLPFTLVFAGNGSVLHRKIGQLSEEELRAWV
ncbi:redoxin family protein [Xylophilus sp. Kf1]|nr:redoxin family protein [Xylophilus sp. Kf1]